MEREQLQRQSTLVVTVESTDEFHDDVQSAIAALDRGESVDSSPTIAFESYDELMATLTPRTLDLIEAIRREAPASINETARVVDRDVKNVHEELTRLAQLGIVYFEADGRSKRPVVWFDELVINLPFEPDSGDAAAAPS
jgi:predicted transcriptional regulator